MAMTSESARLESLTLQEKVRDFQVEEPPSQIASSSSSCNSRASPCSPCSSITGESQSESGIVVDGERAASSANGNHTEPQQQLPPEYSKYPIKLGVNSVLGRYLISSRAIAPGEILLEDEPIFTAPNGSNEGRTCLGCSRRLKENEGQDCSKCGWPVCSEVCQENPNHSLNECGIFEKHAIKAELPPPFCFVSSEEFIKVLRCILLKLEGGKKWEVLSTLESHMEERKDLPKVRFVSSLSRKFIREMCHLEEVRDEDVDLVLGIIDVNAFRHTVHPNNPLKMSAEMDRNGTFLYPVASMAAHGCRRNVRWETQPSGRVQMWAAEAIQEDTLLSHPYVDLMTGTPERRRQLKDQFYFDCRCPRCSDPREMGTDFSTLKCPDCGAGDLLPEDPLNYESDWTCCSCKGRQSYKYERDLVKQVRAETKAVLEDSGGNLAVLRGLAKLLGKYRGKRVHANHYCVIDIEYNLVKRMALVKKAPVDMLHEMKRLILKYLDIAVVFYPGIK